MFLASTGDMISGITSASVQALTGPTSADGLSKMTVAALRAALKDAGLSTLGKKASYGGFEMSYNCMSVLQLLAAMIIIVVDE